AGLRGTIQRCIAKYVPRPTSHVMHTIFGGAVRHVNRREDTPARSGDQGIAQLNNPSGDTRTECVGRLAGPTIPTMNVALKVIDAKNAPPHPRGKFVVEFPDHTDIGITGAEVA